MTVKLVRSINIFVQGIFIIVINAGGKAHIVPQIKKAGLTPAFLSSANFLFGSC